MNTIAKANRDEYFKKTDMSDWPFTLWLRKHGWDGNYYISGNANVYTRDDGFELAVVFYNNTYCTSGIWLRRNING